MGERGVEAGDETGEREKGGKGEGKARGKREGALVSKRHLVVAMRSILRALTLAISSGTLSSYSSTALSKQILACSKARLVSSASNFFSLYVSTSRCLVTSLAEGLPLGKSLCSRSSSLLTPSALWCALSNKYLRLPTAFSSITAQSNSNCEVVLPSENFADILM